MQKSINDLVLQLKNNKLSNVRYLIEEEALNKVIVEADCLIFEDICCDAGIPHTGDIENMNMCVDNPLGKNFFDDYNTFMLTDYEGNKFIIGNDDEDVFYVYDIQTDVLSIFDGYDLNSEFFDLLVLKTA